MACHGAAAGFTFGAAVDVPVPRSECGDILPLTTFSGAPPASSGVNPPGCSRRFTVAGAVPVFLSVIVAVAEPPHATVLSIAVGVTVTWPALSVKLASVAWLTRTFTVAVAVV